MGHVANDIGAEVKKCAILHSVYGFTTYQLIWNLSTATKNSDLSYEDLLKLMGEHFHPRWLEIVQLFDFNSRFRQSNETIAAFGTGFHAAKSFESVHCSKSETMMFLATKKGKTIATNTIKVAVLHVS